MGVLPVEVIRALRQRPTPIEVSASLVTITQQALNYLRRDSKQARGVALSEEDIEQLPDIIAESRAVLWDKEENSLLFVITPAGEKQGKVVVRVEHARDRKLLNTGKQRMTTNSIPTAGYTKKDDLSGRQYEIITGKL